MAKFLTFVCVTFVTLSAIALNAEGQENVLLVGQELDPADQVSNNSLFKN